MCARVSRQALLTWRCATATASLTTHDRKTRDSTDDHDKHEEASDAAAPFPSLLTPLGLVSFLDLLHLPTLLGIKSPHQKLRVFDRHAVVLPDYGISMWQCAIPRLCAKNGYEACGSADNDR